MHSLHYGILIFEGTIITHFNQQVFLMIQLLTVIHRLISTGLDNCETQDGFFIAFFLNFNCRQNVASLYIILVITSEMASVPNK